MARIGVEEGRWEALNRGIKVEREEAGHEDEVKQAWSWAQESWFMTCFEIFLYNEEYKNYVSLWQFVPRRG
jgi:hypothetical protein